MRRGHALIYLGTVFERCTVCLAHLHKVYGRRGGREVQGDDWEVYAAKLVTSIASMHSAIASVH